MLWLADDVCLTSFESLDVQWLHWPHFFFFPIAILFLFVHKTLKKRKNCLLFFFRIRNRKNNFRLKRKRNCSGYCRRRNSRERTEVERRIAWIVNGRLYLIRIFNCDVNLYMLHGIHTYRLVMCVNSWRYKFICTAAANGEVNERSHLYRKFSLENEFQKRALCLSLSDRNVCVTLLWLMAVRMASGVIHSHKHRAHTRTDF